jgi:hypothetical protein
MLLFPECRAEKIQTPSAGTVPVLSPELDPGKIISYTGKSPENLPLDDHPRSFIPFP